MSDKIINRGKFISFEGGEGVGKSTQIALLKEKLEQRGIDVVFTREPGGSSGADEIRRLVLTGDPEKWTAMTEVLLFYAARVDHLERTILPALKEGKWVVSDRYADSTMAYQGAGHKLEKSVIKDIHRISTNDVWPDITIILDHDPSHALKRANDREAQRAATEREDRFEKMADDFHIRLREAFLEIADENPDRCAVIDADGTIQQVSDRVWNHICSKTDLGI